MVHLSTFLDLLFYHLTFNHARYVQGGLFYPFTTPTLDANAADDAFIASVNSAGNDQLRCFAIRNVAVAANKIMHSKTAHASVRAGASGKKCFLFVFFFPSCPVESDRHIFFLFCC